MVYKILLITLISLKIFANNCFGRNEGKIRFINNGSQVVESAEYCTIRDGKEIIMKKCTYDRILCMSTSIIQKSVEVSNINSDIGNPLFKVCHTLGGSPKIIEFWNGKGWKKSSICTFKDKSYIGLNEFYSHQNVTFN
jgi:hypothetical protein